MKRLSKYERIRELKRAHPKWEHSQIAACVAEEYGSCTPSYVSNALREARRSVKAARMKRLQDRLAQMTPEDRERWLEHERSRKREWLKANGKRLRAERKERAREAAVRITQLRDLQSLRTQTREEI